MPNGRCRLHGGLTPSGVALPQTTHGRYSKHLPTRLAARYRQAQADPDLLALRDEVALLDARLAELLDRLGTGESHRAWSLVARLYGDLQEAIDADDLDAVSAATDRLGRLAANKLRDDDTWGQAFALIEQRRKLVESEGKRLQAMSQMLSTEDALALVGQLVAAVRRHVDDRATLAGNAADLDRVLATGAVAAARPR